MGLDTGRKGRKESTSPTGRRSREASTSMERGRKPALQREFRIKGVEQFEARGLLKKVPR